MDNKVSYPDQTANSAIGKQEILKPTMLGDFIDQLDYIIICVEHQTAEIRYKLNEIVNTNFPQAPIEDRVMDKEAPRGNDGDTEFRLFQYIERLRNAKDELTDLRSKLCRIV